MRHNSTWSEKEKVEAIALRRMGLTYAEIGAAVGRTSRAAQCVIERSMPRGDAGCYDGPPIAKCAQADHLRRNAIDGSARLLAQLREVFA